MKKLFCFLLYVLILLNSAMAQEVTVKSFVLAQTDLTAQTEGRKDLNGDACALVKINFVGNLLDVEGNVIKPLMRRNSETWAYMTQGAREMKVYTKDALPLMVTFGNYGIDKLQSNRTYVLTLVKSSGTAESRQMQTLTIKYSPVSASVLVDNKFIKGSNGVAKTNLPIGQHTFVVACDGYESEEGMVKLKPTAPSNLQITLSKEVASVSQSSQTVIPQQTQVQQSEGQMSSTPSVVSSPTLSNSSNHDGSFSGSVIAIPVKDGICIEMVKVEAGSFDMGATPEMKKSGKDEKPVHRVTLTNGYYIGKYEVTQALWQAVMGSNPSCFYGKNNPIEQVSWNDCQDFITKLNSMTGKRFRLPTEAEWEYAARGGNKSRDYQYSGSNTLGDVAWFIDNSDSGTHAVGTKQPNELGIYDMSGNVYEWCQDRKGSYSGTSQTNPTGAVSGASRVFRGGGWHSIGGGCRSSKRGSFTPNYHNNDLGLRLALSE